MERKKRKNLRAAETREKTKEREHTVAAGKQVCASIKYDEAQRISRELMDAAYKEFDRCNDPGAEALRMASRTVATQAYRMYKEPF